LEKKEGKRKKPSLGGGVKGALRGKKGFTREKRTVRGGSNMEKKKKRRGRLTNRHYKPEKKTTTVPWSTISPNPGDGTKLQRVMAQVTGGGAKQGRPS